jgi:hypothetical protein
VLGFLLNPLTMRSTGISRWKALYEGIEVETKDYLSQTNPQWCPLLRPRTTKTITGKRDNLHPIRGSTRITTTAITIKKSLIQTWNVYHIIIRYDYDTNIIEIHMKSLNTHYHRILSLVDLISWSLNISRIFFILCSLLLPRMISQKEWNVVLKPSSRILSLHRILLQPSIQTRIIFILIFKSIQSQTQRFIPHSSLILFFISVVKAGDLLPLI